MATRNQSKVRRWVKLVLTILAFIAVSLGLGYLVQSLLSGFHIPLDIPQWLALLAIFGIMLAINLSLLPLPFGVSIMLVAAAHWNPVLVALAASVGATLGEFSGYFFGVLGKRVSISEDTIGYKQVKSWISKYGMWAIAFISFQPIIPFDVGGFIAGIARMPVRQFLPAVWIGKFPKYLILIYLGSTVMHFLPHFG